MSNTLWIVLIAAVVVAAVILRSSGARSSGARSSGGPASDTPSTGAIEAGRKLTELLRPAQRVAYDPIVLEEDSAQPVSKFGGVPWLPAGTAWPVCPGCNKPLSFFVQLDIASLPPEAGVKGQGLIQLFLCTEPDSKSDICLETWSHDAQAVVVRVVDTTAPGANASASDAAWPARTITSWKPLVDHPGYEDVETAGFELTEDFMALWEAADKEDRAPACHQGDKLGGWPFWAQGLEYGTCTECGKRMDLVLQIDSEDNVPYMFGDAGLGHICQCRDHPHVLSWGWACY